MLGNIMLGVDADGHSINNLALVWKRGCESALVVGSLVTCVGETDRDREGVLFISPWRPPRKGDEPQDRHWSSLLSGSWSLKSLEETRDPLMGHVLISDDPGLLC